MKQFGLLHLAQSIYEHCGLHFLTNLAQLERKIDKRITELGLSIIEYCSYLEKQPDEWKMLIEILTINETYFYREESQLHEYQNSVLPKLKEANRNRPLRIWSAACSTGEEPYTLAMLALETGLFSPDSIQIVASDINQKVLTVAAKGMYGKQSLSFRRIPQHLLDKYFDVSNEHFKIKDQIMKMVSFERVNLLELDHHGFTPFDIIFCRNVLIYFEAKTIRNVVTNLYQLLNPEGYLFLGHADSITGMGIQVETIMAPDTFYYQKGVSNGAYRGISS